MKPYYEEAGITIYHADCREVLPQLCGDAVITDPPYGETACQWDRRCEGWLEVVNSDCLWCFGSFRFFIESAALFSGWRFAQELIWEKQSGSGFTVDRFNRVHEILAQFYRGSWEALYKSVPREPSEDKRSHRTYGRPQPKHRGQIGSRPYNDDGMRLVRSVVGINNCKGNEEHPTQKPARLLRLPVEYSCPEGGTVIDPFAGSGTTLQACRNLNRRAIGVEIEERYCEIAANRLRQGVLDLA